MRINNIRNIFVFVLLLTSFSACDLFNKDEPTKPNDQFLVSFEKETTYLPTLIKSILEPFADTYPEIVPILDKLEYSVSVYKIAYNTTFKGNTVLASGLVCIPHAAGVVLPVLSYQNGTNTLHSNAPSVNPDNELYLLLEFMASSGFIITIPDYLGFGTSSNMFHPYLHKESTVQTVLDMQRAVKELINNNLNEEIGVEMSNDYYITGYSQGGWATMAIQKEIEENYADVFNLKASACGAGPYNLKYINEYVLGLETYPMPYFLGYIFNSYYNLEEMATPISEVFNSPYDERILTLYDGTKAGEEINNNLVNQISLLCTEDYIKYYNIAEKYSSMQSMFAENSVSAWKTVTPTLLMHGTEDTFVPPTGTNRIFQDFLSKGVGVNEITLVPLQGKTHTTGIIPAGIASIAWFLQIRDAE